MTAVAVGTGNFCRIIESASCKVVIETIDNVSELRHRVPVTIPTMIGVSILANQQGAVRVVATAEAFVDFVGGVEPIGALRFLGENRCRLTLH